jgi:DNA-directed RNA polymerase I, II, and III subunit RPABC2
MDEVNDDSFSDEEYLMESNNSIFETPEDFNTFIMNYEEMKKNYITSPFLNKYEKTRIISERAQQLSNGSIALLKNPDSYSSVYEIAMEELKQRKIPFIIKRPIHNHFEYWKVEDLKFL